jgi:hypothetical protein
MKARNIQDYVLHEVLSYLTHYDEKLEKLEKEVEELRQWKDDRVCGTCKKEVKSVSWRRSICGSCERLMHTGCLLNNCCDSCYLKEYPTL